jgi:PH (Pleckstrin Homology) domain-containing protein
LDADGFYPATLGTRQRVIVGAALTVAFGLPFALSVVLVATSGDLSLLILPLPFLLGLWMIQGLAAAGFRLEEGGIRIERRWLPRLIPYIAIRKVDREPRRVGGLGAVGLNGLFGSYGPRWNLRTGWHYLAITNTTDLVYLHTAGGLVVLSPSRPDDFVAQLSRRLAKEVPS